MRICIVNLRAIGLYDPASQAYFGGAEVESYMLDQLFHEMGHELHILLHEAPAAADDTRTTRHLHAVGTAGAPVMWRRIWKALDVIQPDLVLMKLMGEPSAVVAQWCRSRHRAFIYRAANKRDADLAAGSRDYGWRQSLCFKLTCHDRMLIIAQTKEQESIYARRFNDSRVRYIRNYFHHQKQHRLPFQARRGILWVGHLTDVKRPELVIELARRLPEIPFTVIASTTDRSDLAAREQALQAHANVRYLKNVSFGETGGHFRDARIHLNTSRSEGFPNTFLQAIQAGLPLATTGLDPDDLIEEHGLGFRSQDLDDLASWLRTCHEEAESWNQLSTRVLRFHDAQLSRTRYQDFYQMAMADALRLAAT